MEVYGLISEMTKANTEARIADVNIDILTKMSQQQSLTNFATFMKNVDSNPMLAKMFDGLEFEETVKLYKQICKAF